MIYTHFQKKNNNLHKKIFILNTKILYLFKQTKKLQIKDCIHFQNIFSK